MQFFLFNAETSVATGKSADPSPSSAQNSSGFAALFDDELTAQLAESTAAVLSGQEVAAEDSSVVDVSALLRGKLRAAETGQTPDLLPVKPDAGKSSAIITDNLAQQAQAHTDAPLLATQATSALFAVNPDAVSSAVQLPAGSDSPWLQLISAAEQYAANLGVSEHKTLASQSLSTAMELGHASQPNGDQPNVEQQSASVSDIALAIMSDSSQGLATATTKAGERVNVTPTESMLKQHADAVLSAPQGQAVNAEDVKLADKQMDAADGSSATTTEAVAVKTAMTANRPLDTSQNATLVTVEGAKPLQMADATLASAEQPHLNNVAATTGNRSAESSLDLQPAENNSLVSANSVPELTQVQQLSAEMTDTTVQTSAEKLQGPVVSAPDTAQPHKAADLTVKQQETALHTAQQQQNLLVDVAIPEAGVIERQANSPGLQQAMTQVSQLSFADHQKAANAAEALAQKQQLKAEVATGADPQQGQNQQQSSRQEPFSAALNAAMPDAAQHSVAGQNFDKLSAAGSLATSPSSNLSAQPLHTQQSAATSHAAAVKAAEAQLSTLYLQEPQAAAQLKDRVMYQVQQKIQTAEIRLAPEDLGSVQIKVNLQQDQLSVQFIVQQPQAKEALEQQMPRLKELLQQQGMELTDSQVSQQQQQQQGEKQSRTAQQTRASAELKDEMLPQQAIVRSSDRAVDYYA